jgi:hypothetical protein
MDESRPIDLNYASPTYDRVPFNWRRALWLGLAICVPPIACYAWARFSVEWLVRQSWWHLGQPYEGIYQPPFIERPVTICTAVLALEGSFVVTMVLRRRWAVYWLAVLPAIFVIWMIFAVTMYILDDWVFP